MSEYGSATSRQPAVAHDPRIEADHESRQDPLAGPQMRAIEHTHTILIDAMRAAFETRGAAEAGRLSELMGLDLGADAFWQLALESLTAGQIQIGFAPSSPSADLSRLADFLNDQLALLTGQAMSPLFQATLDPLDGIARRWDQRSFFESLRANRGDGEVAIADAVLTWARDRGLIILWDGSATEGSFTPALSPHDERYETATISTSGLVRIRLGVLEETSLFGAIEMNRQLGSLLDGLPRDGTGSAIEFTLTELAEPRIFGQVLGALDWIVDAALLATPT